VCVCICVHTYKVQKIKINAIIDYKKNVLFRAIKKKEENVL
jgi:hypothetical protein